VIFITHTSFQLYHASFSQSYLKSVHDKGTVDEKTILSSTRLFDICNPVERGEWLDVLIGLIEYLRSGNSKVGFLNNSVEKNMLHKDQEEKEFVEESGVLGGDHGGIIIRLILY
jgi:hypothetical protein